MLFSWLAFSFLTYAYMKASVAGWFVCGSLLQCFVNLLLCIFNEYYK